MKAKELINLLEQVSPEAIIVVRGYEEGYNMISELKPRKILHKPRAKWYCGEYADNDSPEAIEVIELFGENKNK